jgi:thiol-disulfide isomerase/thioredoxin
MADRNSEEALETHGMFTVEWFSPWCAQCKTIAPAYAQLAVGLANQNHSITLATHNTKNEKALAKQVGIDKLPFLIAFVRGDPNGTVFSGDSAVEEMEKWLQEVREANECLSHPAPSCVSRNMGTWEHGNGGGGSREMVWDQGSGTQARRTPEPPVWRDWHLFGPEPLVGFG